MASSSTSAKELERMPHVSNSNDYQTTNETQ